MDRKRISTDSEEVIRRKIRKLEEKLHRKRKSRRRILSLSSEDEDSENEQSIVEMRDRSPVPSCSHHRLPEMVSPLPMSAPSQDCATTGEHSERPLEEDVLKLLGDAPAPEDIFGKSIHIDIASRWQEILVKGLPREVKDKLLGEYLIPGNCQLLTAPLLNPEVKAALSETFIKRDKSLMEKQKQISIALSALSKALDTLLSNEMAGNRNVLKYISDASRILCDWQYNETKLRRNFIISAVNMKLKDALIESSRDQFLFGTNLNEKLKSAKCIQLSGDALRQKFNKKNFVAKTSQQTLNYRGLHREYRTSSRSDAGRGRGTTHQHPPPRQRPAPRSHRAAPAPPASPPPIRRAGRRY